MSHGSKNPSYVLVTPARNEQANIERTIRCVLRQTQLPLRWVIVNDASTDATAAIARKYAEQYPWIEVVEMPRHRDRSFAAKVHSFKAGYERVQDLSYDVVGNLDADLSFDDDYFEFLMSKFDAEPTLGVAGTIFHEAAYSSETNSFEGHQHVAGGAQMFRRQCFDEIGGYVPNKMGGIDWIAVTTARMKGWTTRAYRERAFFHHRSLGTAERGRLASAFSYGEKDYYLGNSPTWQIFRVCYQLTHRPYVLVGGAVALGYLSAAIRRIPRPVSAELLRYHRAEQMLKLKAILGSLVRLRRLDSFQVTPH